ncbi:MAG: DUF4250 domain-containing protein [Clostridia bacterium]|nr:DUF4250 domain-containing protein [Clostridia bacterium]
MALPNDPVMLACVINTKLRDDFSSFEELCGDLDEDRAVLEAKLDEAGFFYDEQLNRFVKR